MLTLPPGFPAADTAGMPLAGTLQPIDIGFKYKRFDLGGTYLGEKGWSANLSLRHDERDGTRPTSGSFFSTASQLVAPVDEKTDGAELTVAYATKQLQATVELPVLVVPQRQRLAHLVEPVLPGRAGRDDRPARRWRRTTSSTSSAERPATTSRRRSASAARWPSAG